MVCAGGLAGWRVRDLVRNSLTHDTAAPVPPGLCFRPVWCDAVVQFTTMERLNKYLAHAGVGSRRFCETLITAGRVKIDGIPVTDLGVKIDPNAHKVSVDDHPVRVEKTVYWAVNKPV